VKKTYAVRAENLNKIYKLYASRNDRVKEAFHPLRKQYHNPFSALKGISFEVQKGETFGIVGENGSGKSTLLQIISGVLQPTSGFFEVNGRVSALLELGAGFNHEFSGMENIFRNGAILGMNRNEMEEKLDRIIQFADIGKFIDQPVKTYSSGMYVRLAFAIAISVDPEILVVDEALAVGDMYFQHKCMHRMKKLMEQGLTVIFVSHDMVAVKSLCRRAMFIEQGRILKIGNAEEIVNLYSHQMMKRESQIISEPVPSIDNSRKKTSRVDLRSTLDLQRSEAFHKRIDGTRGGTGEARVANVELCNEQGEVTNAFLVNESIRLRVYIEFYADCENPNVGFLVRDKNGVEVIGTNLTVEKLTIPPQQAEDFIIINFTFKNILKQGSYSIAIGVGISEEHGRFNLKTLDWVDNAVVFKSEPLVDSHIHSLVSVPVDIQIQE